LTATASWLSTEYGTIRKRWKDGLPVALLFPNTYPLAASNLGFQLVYYELNRHESIICERFVYPSRKEPFRSLESNRPLDDFPLVFASISFEQDYQRLIAMLLAGSIEPLEAQRPRLVSPGNPLLIFGGVALMINPEPLAPFADCMVIGEAEAVLPDLIVSIEGSLQQKADRNEIAARLAGVDGCYIPSLYSMRYDDEGRLQECTVAKGAPSRIRRMIKADMKEAAHSRLLSPEAELSMFMTELGRGCSRGCRFCAAGFVYRPPRLWDGEVVLNALDRLPAFKDQVGLLGMEMADPEVLDQISSYLEEQGCALSFSSLRADRISDRLLSLLAVSGLKSVAIAPDGASERLRRVINKGLTEKDLIAAACGLVGIGIVHIKLYLMVGLPTETMKDLDEFVELLEKIRQAVLPIGRKRGQVAQFTLSVNSFVPKPWTPFQYHNFGGQDKNLAYKDRLSKGAVIALKEKIKYLRKKTAGIPNLQMQTDAPDRVLEQAVLARGDRRLAMVLLDLAQGRYRFKQAMKHRGLSSWEYAVRPRDLQEPFGWDLIDHGIQKSYLQQEYERAYRELPTAACDTACCRRCGVC
jgi:radical SAM superfamily enzyme YgiQ (UPF0313 family)